MNRKTPGVWAGKTYWLIGASEGLGRALARELSDAGATLVISARNRDRLEDLAALLPSPAHVAPLDLRETSSVEAAFVELPPLDGMIYCAGAYDPVAATGWDPVAVETMFDVNLTGAARALGAIVPALVKKGGGHIVLIGSLAGVSGLPRSIGYGASKAGLIQLAESLRIDLPRPAFKVQLINPGFIETRLTAKNDFRMPFLLSAPEAARRTRRLMERPGFRGYFPWRFAILFRIGRCLPDWLYFRLVRH
jgi:short-subunit dehydrogenase